MRDRRAFFGHVLNCRLVAVGRCGWAVKRVVAGYGYGHAVIGDGNCSHSWQTALHLSGEKD